MSYIKQHKRNEVDPIIDQLHNALVNLELDEDANNMEGNLNYVITRLLRKCYSSNSYGEINDAMGVLSCIMMEHYRAIATPIQNQKCFENGDIEIELQSRQVVTPIIVDSSTD